ncbi:hypothetical protein A2797_01720 [candidate division WWE3 bacterium RIFCSPHIGHO2_01_FULL_48_15]|uniref:Uncharacterized protein n=1 Tax=candidate division WWE3 bacterium RIFCSPHIGHO2_01_FULL_48_15 TaxID=1802619 RepID=A0A1F4VBL4_UNCKA|nr:MAG: hypothetical protein A2797_01720 [candidate division WWE3 bacterium RIFCSPHIGHO2_01_FULL_48_15]
MLRECNASHLPPAKSFQTGVDVGAGKTILFRNPAGQGWGWDARRSLIFEPEAWTLSLLWTGLWVLKEQFPRLMRDSSIGLAVSPGGCAERHLYVSPELRSIAPDIVAAKHNCRGRTPVLKVGVSVPRKIPDRGFNASVGARNLSARSRNNRKIARSDGLSDRPTRQLVRL